MQRDGLEELARPVVFREALLFDPLCDGALALLGEALAEEVKFSLK